MSLIIMPIIAHIFIYLPSFKICGRILTGKVTACVPYYIYCKSSKLYNRVLTLSGLPPLKRTLMEKYRQRLFLKLRSWATNRTVIG